MPTKGMLINDQISKKYDQMFSEKILKEEDLKNYLLNY